MKKLSLPFLLFCLLLPAAAPARSDPADQATIQPREYAGALRNPLKGFTNRGFSEDNPWATLIHVYIPWNQIENEEADGIDKIRQFGSFVNMSST